MQLPRGRRRQIPQSSRPEGPLAYARLSDPILVKRAKDGDARALEAICERHGSYQGKTLFRCKADVATSVREMRPESSCYTFEHGKLDNVTRHVSC